MTLLRLDGVDVGTWRRPMSLGVREAETVLLLGRNGAGKTTLLNTLAGLLPIKAGRLVLDGEDVTELNELGRSVRGIRIALEGRQVFTRLSVRKNLLLGAFARPPGNDVNRDLEWLLGVFPALRTKLDEPAEELSGGQQTQVNVARALMSRPRLLLLDEPALGLDPLNARQLIRALEQIRSERGTALLIAEQGGVIARAFCERIILLVGGEVKFDGSLQQAKKEGHLRAVLS